MPSIEELQAQLAEKIEKLDQERQANAAKATKEREELLLSMEIERRERLEAYQQKVAEHESKKKAEEAEREAQRIRDVAERIATEQKQAALAEVLRLQREKLEWLETAISNAQFTEEQHKKSIENMRIQPALETETGVINVENPEAPSNGGEAVTGTSGDTPETPLMSEHLKQILRQAQRS
jgi:hypothetical protein